MSKPLKLGLTLAVGCLIALFVLMWIRPYGVLDHYAPMTVVRRVTAGVAMLLNLGFYAGVGLCIYAGVRRLRRGGAAPSLAPSADQATE